MTLGQPTNARYDDVSTRLTEGMGCDLPVEYTERHGKGEAVNLDGYLLFSRA